MARTYTDKQLKNAEKLTKKALEALEDLSTQIVINTTDEYTEITELCELKLREILIKLGKIT